MEREIALPQWVFGLSGYAHLGDGRIVLASRRDGTDRLSVLDPRTGGQDPWDAGYDSVAALVGDGGDRVAVVGGSGTRSWELALGEAGAALSVVRPALGTPVEDGYVSQPEHVEFRSPGCTARAFFYAPAHPHCRVPAGEKPPLIVTCHGGPTGAASPVLSLAVQFWTSRGFAVAVVHYHGSTGDGRGYMRRQRGEWGRLDVEDCVAAARHLAEKGAVDPRRMSIRGKSAGGLTLLAALIFHDVFRAGVCYYAVADLESLAGDTHKFESRYLEGLIGPYPEAKEVYRSRSPLVHARRLRTPVIFFQGLEDAIVPPAQTESLLQVLRERKLPHAYVTFENEGHGFRQQASIERALEAELAFLGTESDVYKSGQGIRAPSES
jgi:dipeptidyl aminopeptidase/acylaminoacyl peptidase